MAIFYFIQQECAKGIQTSYVGARAENLAESLANPAIRKDTNKGKRCKMVIKQSDIRVNRMMEKKQLYLESLII